MWTMTKNKVTSFCDQIMERLHLNTCSILKWYSIILFVAPLLYWGLLEFRLVMTQVSFVNMLHKHPAMAVSVIIAITDFLLGYYCWIKKDEIVNNRTRLRTFWILQCFCQLLVGNIICFLLSIFGLRALPSSKVKSTTVSYFKVTIIISTLLYALCILLLGLIGLQGLRG
ncbi:hypothetical protein HMPREF0522_0657 [Lactobacillus iners UPII 143-D]|uniref:hypothetical protein n=1 Tax=Lactobacillus iners TaxID=147802 RepID=UPI0001FD7997|nr:hypothetical protein [Lactobacillus iners]EGC80055.1 hypothetical protein HMPREF0522_0657 [Lactobacillus iners UPII 143-D]